MSTLTNQNDVFANINKLEAAVYNLAAKQGKYDKKPMIAPLLMHAVGEINEAHTAFMSNNRASVADVQELKKLLADDNIEVFKKYFKASVKSTFEDELADGILMLLSIAGYYNVDIQSHIELKHAYNALRVEHSVINDYSK